ncbi:hypothetical protein PTKIN_Ptkin19aG0013100 [Pterospermum kingtungense]
MACPKHPKPLVSSESVEEEEEHDTSSKSVEVEHNTYSESVEEEHTSSEEEQEESIPKTPSPKKSQLHEPQLQSPRSNVKPTQPVAETSTAETTLASSIKKKPSCESHMELQKAKRQKKNEDQVTTGDITESTKKPLFQRVFTEEDEIALLQGIYDYSMEKEAEPSVDMNAFYDFIPNYIHIQVTKNQLSDKIKRLKKRFRNNQGKTFAKGSHEQKIFYLSEKLWGDKKMNDKKRMTATKELSISIFSKKYPMLSLEEKVEKFGLEMIGEEDRAALVKDWLKVHIAELEVFVQRNEVINKEAKLMLEKFKSELGD